MHVDIDHHADLGSPVHRGDVRARLLSLFLLMFCIAFTRSLEAALVSLTLVVILTLWARIPVRVMLRRVRWVLLVLGPVAVLLPILGSDEHTDTELIGRGISILVRGAALILLTLPLFGTARIADTLAAMRALRFPARLTTIFLVAYRYIFVFLDDLRRMRMAMAVRGFEPGGGLRAQRVISAQMGSLILRSFERNDRIYQAMVARGFRGRFPVLREFRMEAVDWLKSAGVTALGVLLILGDVELWQRL